MESKKLYNQLQALPDNQKTPEIKQIIKKLAFEVLAGIETNNTTQTASNGAEVDFNAIK